MDFGRVLGGFWEAKILDFRTFCDVFSKSFLKHARDLTSCLGSLCSIHPEAKRHQLWFSCQWKIHEKVHLKSYQIAGSPRAVFESVHKIDCWTASPWISGSPWRLLGALKGFLPENGTRNFWNTLNQNVFSAKMVSGCLEGLEDYWVFEAVLCFLEK